MSFKIPTGIFDPQFEEKGSKPASQGKPRFQSETLHYAMMSLYLAKFGHFRMDVEDDIQKSSDPAEKSGTLCRDPWTLEFHLRHMCGNGEKIDFRTFFCKASVRSRSLDQPLVPGVFFKDPNQ